MSRNHVPDPAALALALARRIDAAEQRAAETDRRLAELGLDVAALGRGLADLTGQIRRLADHGLPPGRTGRTSGTSGGGVDGGGGSLTAGEPGDDEPGEAEKEEALPQRDWVAVDDPSLAALWLEELAASNAYVLALHDAAPAAVCWPLHPGVVIELLALQAERDAAYDRDRPTPVSEWLARWLPTARTRITDSLSACIAERGHREDGRTYDARGLDLASVAGWWTQHRDTPAPHVLAFPALD